MADPLKLANALANAWGKPKKPEQKPEEKPMSQRMLEKADPAKRQKAAQSLKKAFGG